MTPFSKIQFAACGSMLLFLAGCGGDGLTKIEGRVTYDEKPVERGMINFFPVNGAGPSAAAVVANGKYQVRIAPGEKRVQIEGFRVIGRHHHRNDPSQPIVEDLEQTLPDRFNAKSELRLDVKLGVSTHDFLLKK